MLINKKFIITLGLSSVVTFVALTSMTADGPENKNLKVLPKDISHQQLDRVMDEWSASLGVRCNFCHARDEAAKKMDFASDAKPEKQMARDMFKMTNKINQKYFGAKKDSLGMVMNSGINCNSCHHGNSHPEVTVPQRQHGPPPNVPGVPNIPGVGNPGTPPPGPDHKEK